MRSGIAADLVDSLGDAVDKLLDVIERFLVDLGIVGPGADVAQPQKGSDALLVGQLNEIGVGRFEVQQVAQMDGGEVVFADLNLELHGFPEFDRIGRPFEEAAIIVLVVG